MANEVAKLSRAGNNSFNSPIDSHCKKTLLAIIRQVPQLKDALNHFQCGFDHFVKIVNNFACFSTFSKRLDTPLRVPIDLASWSVD